MSDSTCWCGNTAMTPFSDDYALCEVCQTLVLRHAPAQIDPHVRDDQADFYGRSYWFEHMEQDQGYANIVARSRTDLSDRCVHWLRSVLRYKRPPGKSLELGCGNGSFVAMMQWCGFDAAGLELSPWVVEFARSTFQIPVLLGPLEDQKIEPASLDIIVSMDVLEHLPDPLATARRAAELLKSDGIMAAQTPAYPEGATFAELTARNDPFLIQLKPREHIHLFSHRAVAMLMERAGLGHVWFEPAVFGNYDMFPFASRVDVAAAQAAGADRAAPMATSPLGRSIEALLDLYSNLNDAKKLAEDRQATIQTQARHIEELSADYDRRLAVITREQEKVAELSGVADGLRAKVAELSATIDGLQATVAARDEEHDLRMRQLEEKTATIETMTQHVERLSADYDRRGEVIAELQLSVESANTRLTIRAAADQQQLAQRDERIRQLVADAGHHLDRLAELQSQLEEASRTLAGQHEHIVALSADYDRRMDAIKARDAQIAAQAGTMAAQHEHIVRLSADYDRRLEAIQAQAATIQSHAATIQQCRREIDAGRAQATARAESLQRSIDELRRELQTASTELQLLQARRGVRMLKRIGLA